MLFQLFALNYENYLNLKRNEWEIFIQILLQATVVIVKRLLLSVFNAFAYFCVPNAYFKI